MTEIQIHDIRINYRDTCAYVRTDVESRISNASLYRPNLYSTTSSVPPFFSFLSFPFRHFSLVRLVSTRLSSFFYPYSKLQLPRIKLESLDARAFNMPFKIKLDQRLEMQMIEKQSDKESIENSFVSQRGQVCVLSIPSVRFASAILISPFLHPLSIRKSARLYI